jgi:hypothetical protein
MSGQLYQEAVARRGRGYLFGVSAVSFYGQLQYPPHSPGAHVDKLSTQIDRSKEEASRCKSISSSSAISARCKTLNHRAVSACSARSPRALRRKLQNSAGQCSAHAALQQALHSTARSTSTNNNPTYAYILLDQTNMK